MKIIYFSALVLTFALSSCTSSNSDEWNSIFNGEDINEFTHYLGRPDSSIDVEGLKRDSLGKYLEGFGDKDPLNVFSVVDFEDGSAIRISGQVFGGLVLIDSISNFHLKCKFKWGNGKYDWMGERPSEGGILYNNRNGGRHEFQLHEGDIGSYWSREVIQDVPARYTTELPKAIQRVKPFLEKFVSTMRDTMLIFDPEAPLHHFEAKKKEWQIVIANPYNEKAHGEWNTLEIMCYKNHALHIVNGKVNMVILNSLNPKDYMLPIESGSITLQSGAGEQFYKDINVKEVTEMPKQLKAYLK